MKIHFVVRNWRVISLLISDMISQIFDSIRILKNILRDPEIIIMKSFFDFYYINKDYSCSSLLDGAEIYSISN